MSKERLKEIKQHQYDGYTIWDIGEDNLVWLIKQAERVQELEETVEDYKTVNKELHDRRKKLRKQNKRYHELLVKIQQMTVCDDCREAEIYELVSDELEGEE